MAASFTCCIPNPPLFWSSCFYPHYLVSGNREFFSCNIRTPYVGNRKLNKSSETFSRRDFAFVCHYTFLWRSHLLCWPHLPADSTKYVRDLYFLSHFHFLCLDFESHITFVPFLTVSNKVLNVHMHSWLTIFSCQPHHLSLPAVPSWLHFRHTTYCSPAPWQSQQVLTKSVIDLSGSFHVPSNPRSWTQHITLDPHISYTFCNVWMCILGAVDKYFSVTANVLSFFLPSLLIACLCKKYIIVIYSATQELTKLITDVFH
jgi:hypothetical protein